MMGAKFDLWGSDRQLVWFRWVAIVAYGLALTTMACISFSWQQYSLLLFQGRAYDWLCSGEDVATRPEFGAAACLAQEKRVGDLYSLLTTAQAASGALAGIIVDHLGRRVCASAGVLMSVVSIVLLVESDRSFQALPAAIFLDGLSCNLIAFPALVLADYFPTHPIMATSFVLTAEYGGAIVCPCLFYLWRAHPSWSYAQVWYVFALCITLPLGLAYSLSLPPRSYHRRKVKEEETKFQQRLRAGERPDEEEEAESVLAVAENRPRREWTLETVPHERSIVTRDGDSGRDSLKDFLRALKSPDFWHFELIFNLFMIQNTFYPVVLRDMSGADVAEFQGLFQMSQAFWCLACGALCDYCCTATAMAAVGFTCSVVFLLSLAPSTGLQYLVVSVFTIIHSYVYATRFTFVREAFGAQHRGKILGAIGIGSAITTLLNIPINRTTAYKVWCGVMAAMFIIQLPSLWYLRQRYKRFFHFRAPTKHLRLCSATSIN